MNRLSLTILVIASIAHQLPAESKAMPEWVKGEAEAITLRKPTDLSYLTVTQTATIIRPKAVTEFATLESLNPGLADVMPSLADLVGKAGVSPKFKLLYDGKIESIKEGDYLEAHEYFDCATVLNLTAPDTGRKAVLIQSNMDVDTDGTDPGRKSELKDYDDARLSHSFQPVLAYSWAQSGEMAKNPFLAYYKSTAEKLRALKTQLDREAKQDPWPVWSSLGKELAQHVSGLERKLNVYGDDLRERRSLIASLDPFIVVPMNWIEKDSGIQVGDYVAVIHAGKVLPCIIGDTGPDSKVGEGSQRLARAIDPEASGRRSAVTTAAVTYLVFPNTRPAPGKPNLATYTSEVTRLLGEMGGLGAGVKVHRWE